MAGTLLRLGADVPGGLLALLLAPLFLWVALWPLLRPRFPRARVALRLWMVSVPVAWVIALPLTGLEWPLSPGGANLILVPWAACGVWGLFVAGATLLDGR